MKVTTLVGSDTASWADGVGTSALFQRPAGLAIDSAGTTLYVSDYDKSRIRKVDIASATVTSIAGSGNLALMDGVGRASSLNYPLGLALDPSQLSLYVADSYNGCIRKITLATNLVVTLAGSGTRTTTDGFGTQAAFNQPAGIVADSTGLLFVTDYAEHRVRLVVVATGQVTTLCGSGSAQFADGKGNQASFNQPWGITIDKRGTLFVADTGNSASCTGVWII